MLCSCLTLAVCGSYLNRITEQFEEAEVVSSGEQRSVSGERRRIDVSDVTVCWPDPLTAGTQNACPTGPVYPFQLQVYTKTCNLAVGLSESGV